MENKAVPSIMLIFLLVLVLLCTQQTLGSTTTEPLQWSKTYGGKSIERAYSVVETDDGGYIIAGDTASFGAGRVDFWLVKTDSYGNQLWNKTYGGEGEDYAYSVVQSSDGGYALAGWTASFGGWDCLLVKTDSAGNQQWTKIYRTADYLCSYEANSVIQSSDGGYALAGRAGDNCLLVKTDSAGNHQWTKTYGETGSPYDYEAYSVVQTSDGGYALAGSINGVNYWDFWMVKTDSNGITQVTTPTFSPAAGFYSSAQTISINCSNSGATIRYTLDGSEPSASSTMYTGPFAISTNTTIKAKAFITGMIDSNTATATYTFNISFGSDAWLIIAIVAVVAIAAVVGFAVYYFKKHKPHSPPPLPHQT